MNPYVRDRINRKLETLSDERLYQVLDYVEFLETRYAEKPAPVTNAFQKFTDGVEDTLRAGGLAAGTVAEAVGFLNKAMGVLNNVAQTTKTVATDVVSTARTVADQIAAPPPAAPPAAPPAPESAAPTPPTQPPAA
ncbi:MAG: hypothetical protein ACK5QX_07105 [bacterium]